MYVELLSKSNFTFLTGASHPGELVQAALEKGLRGLALNDRNGLYGVARPYKQIKDVKNFSYIVGSELSFCDHPPVAVLVKDIRAYGILCKLITLSYKGRQKSDAGLRFEDFVQATGIYPKGFVIIPKIEESVQYAFLKEQFSDLYLPLTRYLDGKDKARTQCILNLSRSFDIPIVATNDVYYHEKKRKLVQDVLLSIKAGKPMQETGFDLFPNAERYIKSPKQMRFLFSDFPESLSRTVEIAEKCTFSLGELRYFYPSEWIPQGYTAQSYLEFLVWKHLPERYSQAPESVVKQLKYELKIISELNYADYFLTLYDIVDFAKSKQILCQGRGSAANSAVCYVIGITAIDPTQINLLFERFISAERGEPPDIDVDFEHERREEVIQYIYEKYGRDRAAMVSAVVTYQGRSAFREVCKAFGVPVGTLSAKKVERNFPSLIANLPDKDTLLEKIESVAEEIQGFPRHLTIHSGGFTLSAKPIDEIVPIEPARMEGRTIIQWDKYDLDALGLLKVDVLSLGMLSALRKTLDLVGKKLYEIPHGDKPTYEMIQKCDTVGTFQIESRAQISMLGRLLPECFYDLVVEVAIVRPGPIVGKMVHPYLRRRRGLEKPIYPNKKVEEILGKTLGIPLFQEQIMKLAIDLVHFPPGEADMLRRSINAWRTSAPIAKMAEKLMNGLIKGGLPPSFAQQIFQQIQGFSQYGFPESHAASFALLAYASCYLKCHHPGEFACSLVNSQPMGFYRNDTLLYDAIRHGVQVLPVSFEKSVWDCVMESPKVLRLGFRVVKGLAKKEVEQLIEERQLRPFSSFQDLCIRTHIRKDVLHRLALADRFSDFEYQPRQALWALIHYENLLPSPKDKQLSLFELDNEKTISEGEFKSLDSYETIQRDYSAFSLSTHGHPMSEIRKNNPKLPKHHSKSIRELSNGALVKVSGLVLVRQKPPTAKGTMFSTLEDEHGFIDLIFHKTMYEQNKEVILNNCFITIQGKLQKDTHTVSVLVKNVEPLWKENPWAIEPTQYFYG